MASDRGNLTRKMAAILHADVTESTALVQRDEALTHQRINDAFRRLSQHVNHYGGTVHEIRGDALVAEFSRASDAVCAALAFQQSHNKALAELEDDIVPRIRIGVSLGEVIFADGQATGAGVVLAQRVEQLAEPGDICITGAIHEALPQHMPFDQYDLGERTVKGFDEPVRVYRVRIQGSATLPEPTAVPQVKSTYPYRWVAVVLIVICGGVFAWYQYWAIEGEPDNISIAVMPFSTIGSEDTTQRLADGLTADIITDLSRFKELEIIDLNTAATYKEEGAIDVGRIQEELRVTYLLDGSIQHEGDRMRISAQLVDLNSGSNLWTQRWDRPDEDAFAVQAELSEQVAATLGSAESSAALTAAEIRKAKSRPPASLQAYDYYLLAVGEMGRFTEEALHKGIGYATQAIELDPEYARAYAVRARMHYNTSHYGTDHEQAMQAMEKDALKAVELDPSDPGPRAALAWYYFLRGRNKDAEIQLRSALEVNPANLTLMKMAAAVYGSSGSAEEGAQLADKVLKLDPLATSGTLNTIKDAYFFAERYEDAVEVISRVPPDSRSRGARLFLTFSLALLGRDKEALRAREELLAKYSNISAELLINQGWAFEEEDLKLFIDGFKAADVPTCASVVDLAKFENPQRLPGCPAG